jgi:PAS domain S-box-containing protein
LNFLGLTLHKKSWLFALRISLLFGFFGSIAFATPTKFTQEEIDWLQLNANIKVAVSSDYAPVSFMQENKQFAGISADYLALIEKNLKTVNPNFKFETVLPSQVERAANDPLDKRVDIVVDFVDTPERSKYWQFTKPYLNTPLHLIVRQDSKASNNLNQLGNAQIAVVGYYAAHELLARDYPDLTLVLVDSNQEGLKKVAFGEVQGFVSDLPVASYWASKAQLSGLKVAGELPYQYHISFATSRYENTLHAILEKSLAEISAETRKEIQDRWIIGPFAEKAFFKDGRVWLILASLLAVIWLAGRFKNDIYKTNNRLIKQQLALAELTQNQLHAEQDKDEIIKEYARVAAQTLDVERVSFWFFDESYQQLDCVCLYTKHNNTHSTLPPLQAKDLPIYFSELATHRVIAVEDAMQHPSTKEFVGYLQENSIGALLDSTIHINGKAVGVVCHEHVGGTREWTLDEQTFAGSIADLCRIRIETCLRLTAQAELQQYSDKLAKMVDERSQLLLESEKRYNYVLKHAPIPILILKKSGEIIEVNPEAQAAFGAHRDDMIGKNFVKTIVADESRKLAVAMAARSLRGEAFRDVELVLQNVNGAKLEHLCSIGMVTNTDGQQGQMVAIAQNISQRKALEVSLIRARESAESADRIKSMFVASMSHELRTPLNSIIGFLGVVLHGMSGELNVKQKDQLGRAYNSSKHLLSLITDVIDISKIEAGFLQVYVEKFELATLLTEVQHAVQHLAEEKELALIIDCPPEIKLETDRKRLYQAILNVVSNGLKYSEQGTVKVRASIKGRQLLIMVEDEGIGISDADLANLFKPFVRVDSHLKIKTLGTGLGLYLTRKILSQLLGGEITVKSQLGQGSTFTISVPIKMPQLVMQNQTSILEDSLP